MSLTTYLYSEENRDLYLDLLSLKSQRCSHYDVVRSALIQGQQLSDFYQDHIVECSQCLASAQEISLEKQKIKSFFNDFHRSHQVPETLYRYGVRQQRTSTFSLLDRELPFFSFRSILQTLLKREFLTWLFPFILFYFFLRAFY